MGFRVSVLKIVKGERGREGGRGGRKNYMKGRPEYCGSGDGITLYVTCSDKGWGQWLILTAGRRE